MAQDNNSPLPNASEARLGKLANRTFLSLWSWANPYRKVGAANKGCGCGEEVCDLLVVFGNKIIIFSDKRNIFDSEKSIDIAWNRWYKKAVLKSARQLVGARKWIVERQDGVFSDSACTVPLAHHLPNADKIEEIHLVAVANGAREAAANHYGDPVGSMFFCTEPSPEGKYPPPFSLAPVVENGYWVHIIDEPSIEFLLRIFDTISDFTAYLSARKALLSSPLNVTFVGEEELAGFYVHQGKPAGADWGIDQSFTGISIDFGYAEWLLTDPAVAAGSNANGISYIVDNIIDHLESLINRATASRE